MMRIQGPLGVEVPRAVSSSLQAVRRRIAGLGLAEFRERELYVPSTYLLGQEGKLMRPSLVLMGAYATDQRPARFVDLAVAVELLHTSSLIHDDIIDKDRMRRGVDAVHVRYGSESAILAGDALIAKAINLSAPYGERVMSVTSEAALGMCAGEALDYAFQKRGRMASVAEYTRIAELKSALLIAMCCSVAAVYSGSGAQRRLYSFGMRMGIAFQMHDDITEHMEGRKEGAARRAGRFRPDIVATLGAGGRDGSALQRAVRLQNKYIDEAIGALGSVSHAKLLSGYADALRLRTATSAR